MKNFYTFILSTFSILGFSQTILNQSETASRSVQDPNVVILAPGFNAKSSISNPFYAKIGESTDTPTNPTNSDAGSGNPSGTVGSNSFHDTQGNIEVNGGGQLQYTLPIALPPGVKSVAPQINLVYTSGAGNGIAGYGWSISGITSISRMGRTIEKDGEVSGIKLDYSDYYSFNGQRLILKSGEYGKDGAEYVTEKYSNVKIKSVGTITGQSWQGPLYWEVTFEDGSQAWYGATSDGGYLSARTPLEYNIVKWKDAQGNYINYSYTQANNVAVITSIQWGGNETLGVDFFNEIIFSYVINDFKEEAYHEGIKFLQDKILSKVEVFASSKLFKAYSIEHEEADNSKVGYKLIKRIFEINSNNEYSNPVEFQYSKQSNTQEMISFQNISTNYNTKKYGDFNLDGATDYIEYVSSGSIKYKSSVYLDINPIDLQYDASRFTASDFSQAVPVRVKKDGYIKNSVGLAIPVKKNTSVPYKKDIEIQIYTIDLQSNRLNFEYSKTFYFDQISPSEFWYDEETCDILNPSIELMPYDFNNDGLTELIFKYKITSFCRDNDSPPNSEYLDNIKNSNYYELNVDSTNTDNGEKSNDDKMLIPGTRTTYISASLINIDQTLIQNNVYKFEDSTTDNLLERFSFADFNGDGLEDIVYNNNNNIQKVINIKENTNGYYTSPIGNFANFNFEGYSQGIIYGDFNGDHKIDAIIPQSNKTYNWNLYISNGKTFDKYFINDFIYYSAGQERFNEGIHHTTFESGCAYASTRYLQYNVGDFDGDGKSDIEVTSVLLRDHAWDAHHDEEYTITSVAVYSVNKLQNSSNKSIVYNPYITTIPISNVNIYSDYNTTNTNTIQSNSSLKFYLTKYWQKKIDYDVVTFSTLNINRENQQIILTGKSIDCSTCSNYVVQYSYPFLPIYTRAESINQGGVTTKIFYNEINNQNSNNFYNTSKNELYPFHEIDKVPLSSIVYQLKRETGLSEDLFQNFKYRGFISHFQGRGILGFRQTARSSWYIDGKENTVIWSGTEMDPLNETVPIKEWSVKTFNDNSLIFPADISENNTQLLSYKKTDYQTNTLTNGVKAIVPWRTKTKDFLKDITTDSEITYGDYYLPAQTNTSINGGFATSRTAMTYTHNPAGVGKDYYIGRPESKIESVTAYSDTKSTEEYYEYDNNLLSYVSKYPTSSTGSILEGYLYDGWGNVVEKSTAYRNPKALLTQSEKAQYDDKGRFVIKKTDNLGLETNITYNDWGQVLTQTDPLGVMLTNTYDGWGKLLTSKTNLAGTTTYQYSKLANGVSIITQNDPDGNISQKYTNKLGQEFKTRTKAFGQNNYVAKYKIYDGLSRVLQESEPYFDSVGGTESPGSGAKWSTITYDDTVFPIKAIATSFNGKQIETSVSGRTTSVKELNGNLRTNTKTTDALGNMITATDKGGTITFSYNAAGQQIKAQYDTNIVTTKYDIWGRKIEFNDPSNGIYTYSYDGFGRVLKETSPKGYKQYTYNSLGQLATQKELSSDGTTTNKTITYTYNAKGLITGKSGTANGKAYSSTVSYDSFGRVIGSTENSNGKYYIKKGITYDNKMRITSYEKSLYSSGQYTKVVIEHTYNSWNGDLYQVKDKTQNKVLWELQSAEADGRVISAKLGGTTITNTYDNANFLAGTTQNKSSDNATFFKMSYTFDAVKNELKSRIRDGAISITENFEYDDNNRLTNWTDPVTGLFTQNAKKNVYDIKGRITNNDQVGQIKFDNTQKVYQPTGATLNAAGQQNYTNNLIQKINYNENNDPIFIDGQKGDARFEYGLTEMRQMMTYGGNFDAPGTGKYTKYYSEDGSYEIIRNNQTGQEKHLLYIGGTPYESDIVYLKDFTESSGSYKFLHKDYLGSILAITDEAGNAIEQRHYDAWGNFTHLKLGTQPIITGIQLVTDYLANNNLLIDRGYTSHEHLPEVGLIHMNGRLYDPLLRRFLNADENIQDMFNTQNYNKYGYVLNNPLMYNDPSGELFVLFGLTPLLTAIVVGAAVGLATYVISGLITGQNITLLGLFKATIFGAFSGAVTFGIGDIFAPALKSAVNMAPGFAKALAQGGLAIAQAAAHAVAQGAMSLMQGSNATMGAISGFFGSLGASAWGAGLKGLGLSNFANSGIGTVLSGAFLGGIGSELVGGNFWRGAITGGIVAGLNHAMHQMGGPGDDELIKKLTPEQRKQLEQIKSGTKLTKEALEKTGLDKILDNWIGKTALGKNLKVSVVDYLSMGGEIYYDHKLQQYNGISKNEFTFRLVTKTSTGLISGHFGYLAGAAAGAEYGATVGGLVGTVVGAGIGFYIENTYWRGIKYFDNFVTRLDGYIQRQLIFNARRGF